MIMTKIKERNRYSPVLKKVCQQGSSMSFMYLRNSATQENEEGLPGAFFIRRIKQLGTTIIKAGLRRRYPSLSGNNVVELPQVSS